MSLQTEIERKRLKLQNLKEKRGFSHQVQQIIGNLSRQRSLELSKTQFLDILGNDTVQYEKGLQTEIVDEKQDSCVQADLQPPEPVKPVLSEDRIQEIIQDPEFLEFVNHTTGLIEDELMEEEDYSFEIEPQQLVQLVHQETQRRQCTSTHWSEKYPHLVLATYNHNHSLQSDGLMFIWNLHKQTPEYKLLSTSDLTCAKFSPFHPYLVMGGTFSGQICIWDIRTKTTPVLKAPASRGHSHPVTSLQVSGSLNAHQLLTASNDGLVCTWTLDNLSQPIDSIYVVDPSLRHPDVSVTCLGLLEDEQTRFLAGSENGHMYTVNRYGRAASKSGIDPQWTYKGHNGIITSLDVSGTFVLTSSVDYTVKLWKQSKTQPLRSFEHQDHVYGVQWSPQSSCFASISGTQLHLYDLHQSEQPHTIETNVGLTSLDWDSKGERVACGSVDGSVIVIEHPLQGGDMTQIIQDDE